MAANTQWYEQNGTATGTPAHGTQTAVNSCDWKSVDSATTSRADAPVLAGANSFIKYLYVGFTGSFNQISDCKFAHTSGTLGDNLSLKAKVSSTYATPTAAALSGATDITNPTSIDSGIAVGVSTTGPNGTSATSANAACFTQYIITQVQTTNAAAAGDSAQATLTLQYNEN